MINIKFNKLLGIFLVLILCGCRQIINYSIPLLNEIAYIKSSNEIWTMNTNGENKVRLLKDKHLIGQIGWSPDGRKIFVEHLLESKIYIPKMKKKQISQIFELKIIDISNKKITNLLKGKGWLGYMAWSPDGNEIIFSREGEIYCFNCVQKKLKKLISKNVINEKYLFSFSISPNKEYIIFEAQEEYTRLQITWKVYLMNLKEKKMRRLTNSASEIYERYPIWSPDGNWIAFYETGKEGRHITLINHRTNQQKRISLPRVPEIALIGDMDFSPDGKKIIYGTGDEIYTIDLNSKKIKNLTNTPQWEGWERSPSWRPLNNIDNLRIKEYG